MFFVKVFSKGRLLVGGNSVGFFEKNKFGFLKKNKNSVFCFFFSSSFDFSFFSEVLGDES